MKFSIGMFVNQWVYLCVCASVCLSILLWRLYFQSYFQYFFHLTEKTFRNALVNTELEYLKYFLMKCKIATKGNVKMH